jgi:hypothetical protein
LEQVKRLQYWDKQKATRLQGEQEYRQVLEVEECTFQPNPDKPVCAVKPTEIFNRNLEWLQLKQRRDKKALEDTYKALLRPRPNMHRKEKHSPFEILDFLKSSEFRQMSRPSP